MKETQPDIRRARHVRKPRNALQKWLYAFTGILFAALAVIQLAWVAVNVHPGAGGSADSATVRTKANLVSRVDTYTDTIKANLLGGMPVIKKQFQIPESDLVAPRPDPSGFGEAYNTGQVLEVIDQARESLLISKNERMIFNEHADFISTTPMLYYLDESLFAVCWKEVLEDRICSCFEVVMADASQMRRKLSQDTYGSSVKAFATELAAQTNAVAAINADLYLQRDLGITVYNRQLYRFNEWIYTGRYNQYNAIDTLLIDGAGNFNFMYMGEQRSREDVERYIEDHDILYAIAFGPVLVENGEEKQTDWYPLGEINEEYSRAGIAQCGERHYFYMTVSFEDYRIPRCTINEFAHLMFLKGVDKAYALDGGQTGELVFNGQVYNRIDFDAERTVSDIIYFASAIGDAGGGSQ